MLNFHSKFSFSNLSTLFCKAVTIRFKVSVYISRIGGRYFFNFKNSVNLRFVSVTLSSLVDLISLRFDIIAGPHSLMLGYLFVNRLIYL